MEPEEEIEQLENLNWSLNQRIHKLLWIGRYPKEENKVNRKLVQKLESQVTENEIRIELLRSQKVMGFGLDSF